ncbi:hypothetical protein M569_01826, partial [Genlisea aurea]
RSVHSVLPLLIHGLWFIFLLPVNGFRPLRESHRPWGDELLSVGKEEYGLGSSWNISGTYRGNWNFIDSANSTSKFPKFRDSTGNSVLELITSVTKITGVHYVQGVMIFHDVFDHEYDFRGAHVKVEGVYIWPFRQLRLVAVSGKESQFGQEDDMMLSNPYHLVGVFSTQVFLEPPRDKDWKKRNAPIYEMEKRCNIEIAAHISRISTRKVDGGRDKYHLEGLMESPSMDEDVDCFPPMQLNATSVNVEIYYNKAVNYSLLVTFISFLEVLLLMRQMDHSNTQS